MNKFIVELGRQARKRKNATGQEQVEPRVSGHQLGDWRFGYGGQGLPCPTKRCPEKPSVGSVVASAVSVTSPSTTAKDSPIRSARVATAPVRKQAALFDPGEPKPAKVVEPKLPDTDENELGRVVLTLVAREETAATPSAPLTLTIQGA